MLDAATRTAVEAELGNKIKHIEPLSGGSTSKTCKLVTEKVNVVLKWLPNASDDFFAAEVSGLHSLQQSGAFNTPEVIAVGDTWLLQQYVKPDTTPNWQKFGEQLALLHHNHAEDYGFAQGNYFAILPQQNDWQADWCRFYREQRLRPLFNHPAFTVQQRQQLESIANNLESFIDNAEKPRLIHGDLWRANIIFNQAGIHLIDPATYYASREMELAYLEFVGDAHIELVESYHYHFPIDKDFYQRKNLYLLYPYLCHLHLYGDSYLPGLLSLVDSLCITYC